MSLANHVTLNITTDSAGLSRANFGTPLTVSNTAGWVERAREYSGVSAVGSDFATTSPEYLTAQATFAQNPHVAKLKIGRAANTMTKIIKVTVVTATNTHAYSLNVVGEGVTTTTATYTSDATATKPEITAGLKVQLDAVVGKNFTVVDDLTDTLTITGDAAGDWFAIASTQANLSLLNIREETTDAGIAADIAAIQVEDDDWYFLLTHFNGDAAVAAAVADVEAKTKMYIVDMQDYDAYATVEGSGDTLDTLKTSTRARTAGIWHWRPYEFAAAAWIGDTAWQDPGRETWKFRTLSGVTPASLTSTQRTNVLNRNANLYETIAGRNIMTEGTTGDGDFIDVQRFIDWLQDDMSKSVFEVLADATAKVGYDDTDIGRVEAAIWGSLRRGIKNRGLKENPEPTVSIGSVDDQSTANKTARTWTGITFDAKLLGAVHKLTINGTVSAS